VKGPSNRQRTINGCPLWAAVVLANVLLLSGCTTIPEGRSAIDVVEVRGANAIDDDDVLDRIASAPSGKFLGLFRGIVYEYEVYDATVLQRDLARITRYYHGQGFQSAEVRVARVERTRAGHVRIEVIVREGLPTLNSEVRIDGLESLPELTATAARNTATRALRIGRRFDEDKYQSASSAIRSVLTEHGYAYAEVLPSAEIDVVAHTVRYRFTVHPGPAATFGPITFVGLDPDGAGERQIELSESKLRQALDLYEGEPYSSAAISAAEQALLDLEVFSAVEITPTLTNPPPASHSVPLTVRVEPTRLRQLRLGGGAEFDQLKTDVHLLAGWEDHNFLGGLRDFSIDVKPGAVLYPTRINNLVAPERLLPEERLKLQLRQPGFLEARTNGFVRSELNIFPLLVDPHPASDAPVVGFREVRWAAGADRRFWKFLASLAYNVQLEMPFSYKGPLDPALSTLTLLFPQLITSLDFRDNPVTPHKGLYVANDLQLAGWPGGSARDLRVQPEIRGYAPLGRRVTLATRASMGFLFPSNYGDVVQNHLTEDLTDANRAERVRDIETVYWRGFFSGGPSSNRGYPLRGIAPHGVVPFLNPATASQQIALNCNPSSGQLNTNSCSIPIGGFTLWEFSTEMRFRIAGPFTSSLFCDMSDVSQHAMNPRFTHLHMSCGTGARYDTPVGPIRLDIGYRVQPLQVLGYRNETAVWNADKVEGLPPRIFGLPIAISVGIGEAY
jgi:outer membrane protein assembly factor BamA